MEQKRKFPQYIIIKTQNIQRKERIFKVTMEKCQVTYKGRPIRIIPDFLVETLKSKRV